MTFVKGYGSVEEMMEDMALSRKSADSRVDPRQAAVRAGDCFMRWAPEADLVVYGEVIDPLAYYEGKDLDADDGELRSEMEYEKNLRGEPHMKFFRFCRCYSIVVEDGELGDTHCSVMMPISRQIFETAKTHGWPSEVEPPPPPAVMSEDEKLLRRALDDLMRGVTG